MSQLKLAQHNYNALFFNFSDCLSHTTLCVTTKQGRVAMATEFQELDVPTFLSFVKQRNWMKNIIKLLQGAAIVNNELFWGKTNSIIKFAVHAYEWWALAQ